MKVTINGKNFEANEGETIFDVAQRNGIEIPTLCRTEKHQDGVCRICVVEIGGRIITSCNTQVKEDMEVLTESEKILEARRINLELLWSDHAGKCVKCVKNRKCELQNLAEKFKIENFHFVPRRGEITSQEELDLVRDNWSRVVVDDQNPAIFRTTEYCVECRRCIDNCPVKAYGFNFRGGDTVVGTPYEKTLDCLFCGWCVKYCPTAALSDLGNLDEVVKKLDDPKILAVAIWDPALKASFSNEFPASLGSDGEVIGLLNGLGFEKVFDLGRGMEKYAERVADEIFSKKTTQPIFSSHCPAFTRYIQKFHPNLEKNISKTPVPDELEAEWIKTEFAKENKIDPKNIFIVAVSSCVAKKSLKYEYLDALMTMRELGRLARKKEIDMNELETDKKNIFTTNYQESEKMIKSGELAEIVQKKLGKKKIRTTVANGKSEIGDALKKIEKKESICDFLEGMLCHEGCEKGGGQSIKLKI